MRLRSPSAKRRAAIPFAALGVLLLIIPPSTSESLAPGGNLALPDPAAAGRALAAETGCAPGDPIPGLLVQLGVLEFTEDPTAGSWQPWFVGPGDVPVPPPPPTASADFALELVEVQQAALQRTDEQRLAAQFWSDGPATKAWTNLYLDLIVEHAAKAGKRNPPRLSREMAILHTAMYDALVVTWAAKYCHQRAPPSFFDPAIDPVVEIAPVPSYPSEHAAVAGVAKVVFRAFFPEDEEPAGSLEAIADEAAESRLWAGANYRSDIEAGMAIGMAVGQAVLDARAHDGANAPSTRVPIEGPCNWKPTAPSYRAAPLEPQWGDMQPFAMAHGAQFRAPPPPACDGPEYLAQYRDVFEASLALTPRQKEVSDYWEAGQGTVTPPGMSLQIAQAKCLEHELSTMRCARVMSYVGVAVADAAIVAWDTKFAYWFDRPITAIRRLGWDVAAGLCTGGIDTHPANPYGGCWLSHAVTPPFPGYISGHSTFTGAGMQTLKYFFPQDEAEFRAYSTEAAMARFYGGIHFRADNDQGIESGIGLGNLLQERAANDGADF